MHEVVKFSARNCIFLCVREVVYFCVCVKLYIFVLCVKLYILCCAGSCIFLCVREVVYFLHPSSPREMPPGRHASHANLTDLPKLRPPPVRL